MIVLKGRVLDGNGGAPIEKGAVVLEDDRIRLVCRQSELPDDHAPALTLRNRGCKNSPCGFSPKGEADCRHI